MPSAYHHIRQEISPLAFPVTQLQPYPRNSRVGDTEAIAESLTEHGQYHPILARISDRMIIAGHHVWMAAGELGWTHIAVSFIECSDEDLDSINLIDNQTSSRGQYDVGLLLEQLKARKSLKGTGYTVIDVERLLQQIDRTQRGELGNYSPPPITCPACGHTFVKESRGQNSDA